MIKQETKDKCLKIYIIIKKQIKWFVCQVFVSFAPLCIVYVLAEWLQYDPVLEQVFPDYLLAAFAVGFNLINTEIKNREDICVFIKDIYRLATFAITISTALIYVGLFGDNYVSIKVKKLEENYTHIFIITILALLGISTLIVVISNGRLEYKKEEKNEKIEMF